MKPARKFDESKLTPPQKKALAIAKAQGIPLVRSSDDLVLDLGLTPEESAQFDKTLRDMREESRRQPPKKF